MVKGIYQIAMIGGALVTSAFAEAVIPIWIANQTSTATHITSSREYGSLEGWRTCMAEGWSSGNTMNGNTLHRQCNSKLAAYQNGTLKITNIKLDDDGLCSRGENINSRSFSGLIGNPTADIYLTNYSWLASYPAVDDPIYGGAHIKTHMLAPGESRQVCLFTLKFENAADAARYDTHPQLLAIAVSFERGVKDKSTSARH